MGRWVLALAALAGAAERCSAQLEVTITGGKSDARNVPVIVPLNVPDKWAKATNVKLVDAAKQAHAGQLTAPGIVTENAAAQGKGAVRRDLHVVLPDLKAGATRTLTIEGEAAPTSDSFTFKETKGSHADLYRGDRPVFRYMHRPFDNSSEAKREETYKVFHHLYDPAGTRLVTNGGQADPDSAGKKLLYPHHRGLMFAFNKITYGDNKKADTWHAQPKGVHEAHTGFLNVEAGAVLGRHRVGVDWVGADKDVFAKEERELTVYAVPGGTLVEFATRLKSTGGKVRLDGDPQHAGFQFRAHNDVSQKTAKQTYYLRPDGKGKEDDTRNWEPKAKKGPVNLPWDVLCFVLDGKRYSVEYIDHPSNPGEKRYSERNYGRFGCYFEYDLGPDRPLVLNHRIWLQDGEMTRAQAQALCDAFTAPPKFAVK